MAAILTLLLIGSLLLGVRGEFKAFIPQRIEALSGSCVTIPCSFEITKTHESNLHKTCEAIWKNYQDNFVFGSNYPQQSTVNGDLTKKDCTTTLHNVQPAHSNKYYFRLDCNNKLKYNFLPEALNISVKVDPPRPTLTPSTLKVMEGTSVTLTCSAPALCLLYPPTLTWSPGLGEGQEMLQLNQDKTKVKTSVVNFTASYHHQGKSMSCTATYHRQDGSGAVANTGLTADISYCPKDTTVSVHPSGPVPEDSNVTLTCSSTANPAVRNYTWYTSDGEEETVIGTGQVLNIKASKDNSSFFCKTENDIGVGQSSPYQIDVQFAPQILPLSDCAKAATQLTCSCRTVGNPFPTLQWHLDGLPINHSDKLTIRLMHLNGVELMSIVTVNEPQKMDLSTLICHSSNSLGSATHRFCVNSFELQAPAQRQDPVTLLIFITIVIALLIIVFALLLVNRAQRIHHNLLKKQNTAETSPAAMNQLLTRGEGNKVPNTTEEDIYVIPDTLRQADVSQPETIAEPNTNLPSSGPNDLIAVDISSGQMTEEGNEVIYSTVTWKTKSKKHEDCLEMHQPGGLYLEDERRGENIKRKVESEYAQVKYKDKTVMNT